MRGNCFGVVSLEELFGGICPCAKSPGGNCRGDNFKEIIV